ncbi:MAG: hypothetical protein K2I00_03200 [Ruminococcus sp.]|nr:hypothetical protein [Ruminococcus sp.]
MMYLTKEELVKNIAEQTERASAIIEHTDFNSDKLNPNSVIIPFLGNIADSAMIVTALDINGNNKTDCHRNALSIVMSSDKIKNTTKNFIRKIQDLRKKYTIDSGKSVFDSAECLDFLNAYDCFMYDFISCNNTVREMNILKFSSFRNIVEKLLKKNTPDLKHNNPENEIIEQIKRNNELLEKILEQNSLIIRILEKLIDNRQKGD